MWLTRFYTSSISLRSSLPSCPSSLPASLPPSLPTSLSLSSPPSLPPYRNPDLSVLADPVHLGAMAYTGLVTSAFAVVIESVALSYVPVEVRPNHHIHMRASYIRVMHATPESDCPRLTHPRSGRAACPTLPPSSCLLDGHAGDDRHPQVRQQSTA